ncbi:MAG: hypothetical protein HON65_01345 [Rhodospirillales bacterium]|jgi:hypothetical protein|nr:hypothetical protein [Rhodospirillales bacterium]
MSVYSILPVAASNLRHNAREVADAASNIVESSVQFNPSDGVNDSGTLSVFNDFNFAENHDRFSDQDLITQVMRIKKAEVAYQASGMLIRTADEMSQVILEAVS